jgi:hypothetical protein
VDGFGERLHRARQLLHHSGETVETCGERSHLVGKLAQLAIVWLNGLGQEFKSFVNGH